MAYNTNSPPTLGQIKQLAQYLKERLEELEAAIGESGGSESYSGLVMYSGEIPDARTDRWNTTNNSLGGSISGGQTRLLNIDDSNCTAFLAKADDIAEDIVDILTTIKAIKTQIRTLREQDVN